MLNRVTIVGRLCNGGRIKTWAQSGEAQYTGGLEIIEWEPPGGYRRQVIPVSARNSLATLLRGRCKDSPMVFIGGRLQSKQRKNAMKPREQVPPEDLPLVVLVAEEVHFLTPDGNEVGDPELAEWANIPGTDPDSTVNVDATIIETIQE